MSDWTMDKAKAMKDFFDRVAEGWDEGNQERSGVRESLIKSLPIKTGDRVLDVGCGTGAITGVLHSMSKEKVTAIDVSPKMIEIAKSKEQPLVNEYICGDFTACDFKHSYDAAVMFNCYPHFMDREALKTALTNSLKKDSYFAIVHNNGRGELFACHKRHMDYSRNILSPEDEAVFYNDYFELIKAEEGPDYYYLLLRLRGAECR